MAYDETLADRIRDVLADTPEVTERKMFGGLAFMVRGHMVCGVVHECPEVRHRWFATFPRLPARPA